MAVAANANRRGESGKNMETGGGIGIRQSPVGICDAELLWEDTVKEGWENEHLWNEAELAEMLNERVESQHLGLVASTVAS